MESRKLLFVKPLIYLALNLRDCSLTMSFLEILTKFFVYAIFVKCHTWQNLYIHMYLTKKKKQKTLKNGVV